MAGRASRAGGQSRGRSPCRASAGGCPVQGTRLGAQAGSRPALDSTSFHEPWFQGSPAGQPWPGTGSQALA